MSDKAKKNSKKKAKAKKVDEAARYVVETVKDDEQESTADSEVSMRVEADLDEIRLNKIDIEVNVLDHFDIESEEGGGKFVGKKIWIIGVGIVVIVLVVASMFGG